MGVLHMIRLEPSNAEGAHKISLLRLNQWQRERHYSALASQLRISPRYGRPGEARFVWITVLEDLKLTVTPARKPR